ncbi:MAG: hypothetical protein KJ950_09145 [Proteobacteria bacterium]|nr:hypothetical protein [Pseudomonadota bacterium]MBU1686660.1 hypothetical protein [Pseudomonadota bacterium]
MLFKSNTFQLLLCLLLTLSGCAGIGSQTSGNQEMTIYGAPKNDDSLYSRFAPLVRAIGTEAAYNRIGKVSAIINNDQDDFKLVIDPRFPVYYVQKQDFISARGASYTNLIYRVHFSEVPFYHLTSGANVGLLIYLTLNDQNQPVLVTTLHTCGCYLAIVPTSYLPADALPNNWNPTLQNVYGESLPGVLDYGLREDLKVLVDLRAATHRVTDIRLIQANETPQGFQQSVMLEPMDSLNSIPLQDQKISFFETSGFRKGYVKGSHKPFEMLLMGWWALDPLIGEDKALGPYQNTGTHMYTSLKFWARQNSDIWDFPTFLTYWGWRL